MCSVGVVVMQPFIQINRQSLDGLIDLFAERGLKEYLQDCLVEPLANAIGLR